MSGSHAKEGEEGDEEGYYPHAPQPLGKVAPQEDTVGLSLN